MNIKRVVSKWAKNPVEWTEGKTAYISVVFTWHMDEVHRRAQWYHAAGYKVKVGGPGTHVKTPAREAIKEFADVGGSYPEAVVKHNPDATFASRGCPVGCWFCIVPSLEGREFTEIDDFTPRPILCDNNLSALSDSFQEHIIKRYQKSGVPLLDAQSGFEPARFTEETFNRWKAINKGPWRFALDDQGDIEPVKKMLDILKAVPPRRKRVYVLVGNEPVAECIDRIRLVLDRGGEPHVQPMIKLNATRKAPWVRFDWTEALLRDVARWSNRRCWRYCDFHEYSTSIRTKRIEKDQLALF